MFFEKEARSLAYWVIDATEEYTKFATLKILQTFSLDCDDMNFYFKRSG